MIPHFSISPDAKIGFYGVCLHTQDFRPWKGRVESNIHRNLGLEASWPTLTTCVTLQCCMLTHLCSPISESASRRSLTIFESSWLFIGIQNKIWTVLHYTFGWVNLYASPQCFGLCWPHMEEHNPAIVSQWYEWNRVKNFGKMLSWSQIGEIGLASNWSLIIVLDNIGFVSCLLV